MALTILGSTGSIGRQTLEVARDLGVPVRALAAGRNAELLEAQARRLRPKYAVLHDEGAARELKTALADTPVKVTKRGASTRRRPSGPQRRAVMAPRPRGTRRPENTAPASPSMPKGRSVS